MQLKDISKICHNASYEILVNHILYMNKYTSKCKYDIKNQKRTRISVIIPVKRTNCNLAEFDCTCFYASENVPVGLVYQLH